MNQQWVHRFMSKDPMICGVRSVSAPVVNNPLGLVSMLGDPFLIHY